MAEHTDQGLRLRAAPAGHGKAPSRQYGLGRKCSTCDAPLSRYNPDVFCALHTPVRAPKPLSAPRRGAGRGHHKRVW